MQIKKGIMLYSDAIEGHGHIAINAGVVHHRQVEKHKVEYGNYSFTPCFEEDAYIPKRSWRGLNERELLVLKPTEKRTKANTVYIGKIPEDLKSAFEGLRLGDCKERAEVLEAFRSNADAVARINRELGSFLSSKSDGKAFNFHYLGSNLPNLEVVASDTTRLPADHSEEDKVYMGIHNDGTKYVPLNSLFRSGNRLTINLGKEARSFLFVNLTLPQALNMLKKKMDIRKDNIDVINISKAFFKYFPDYPVIRVEQKPYQYYIAPTDNCFHDGCTLGTKELDIILVYFGAFKF
ncbi:MAG TPA: hypothetical protein VFE32_20565 [Puia sp.]|jgi:hypothetical protein|nr:hypothetical protein [Puia sp.]